MMVRVREVRNACVNEYPDCVCVCGPETQGNMTHACLWSQHVWDRCLPISLSEHPHRQTHIEPV